MPPLTQQTEATLVLVGDDAPYVSAAVPGRLFSTNKADTLLTMRSDGTLSDGLTDVRLAERRAWRLSLKGTSVLAAGRAPQRLRALLRLGDACFVSQVLACAGHGDSVRCRPLPQKRPPRP